jgi:transposase
MRLCRKNHPVRETAAVLDLSWVHSELAPYCPRLGRPSIDPLLMIRMLMVGYVFGIRSEHALCREVGMKLAYRWFWGLSIEDKVPDHSVFSQARNALPRQRHLPDRVLRVVGACIELGSDDWFLRYRHALSLRSEPRLRRSVSSNLSSLTQPSIRPAVKDVARGSTGLIAANDRPTGEISRSATGRRSVTVQLATDSIQNRRLPSAATLTEAIGEQLGPAPCRGCCPKPRVEATRDPLPRRRAPLGRSIRFFRARRAVDRRFGNNEARRRS